LGLSCGSSGSHGPSSTGARPSLRIKNIGPSRPAAAERDCSALSLDLSLFLFSLLSVSLCLSLSTLSTASLSLELTALSQQQCAAVCSGLSFYFRARRPISDTSKLPPTQGTLMLLPAVSASFCSDQSSVLYLGALAFVACAGIVGRTNEAYSSRPLSKRRRACRSREHSSSTMTCLQPFTYHRTKDRKDNQPRRTLS